jgi:hypothetical protein
VDEAQGARLRAHSDVTNVHAAGESAEVEGEIRCGARVDVLLLIPQKTAHVVIHPDRH